MLKKHWMTAGVVVLLALGAPLAAQDSEDPQPIEASGVIADFDETDDGELFLILTTGEDTDLTFDVTPETAVWYADVEADQDVLWEELGTHAEVEYLEVDGKRVLLKVRLPELEE